MSKRKDDTTRASKATVRRVGFASMTVKVYAGSSAPGLMMLCDACGETVTLAGELSLDDLRTDYAIHITERHL